MAFNAGAVVGKIILDPKDWVKGVKTVQSSGDMMKKGFTALKTGAVAIGAALTGAFTASVVQADKWQKSFANVSTLVDTAQVDVQGMAKELLGLDGSLGSATELTEGLYQALSASVEPGKAVEFVAKSAEFAKAALVDTNTAVDVITTGLNAYGLEAGKAGDISDKLFTVIKTGKTTGDELAATIGQSIPLAANMGISFDELGASVAIMTRQGINASEATTQFNASVNAFLKPSDDMAATLKEMGFESGEAAIQQLGFKGALDAVTATTGGSKEALAGLFNNTRALRGVLALTGEGAADFDSILEQVTNSAGATTEAFGKQELTFETLKNQMGTISILAGNVGKVFVDQLATGASSAAQSMIDFVLSGRAAEPISTIVGTISGAFNLLKGILEPVVDTVFPLLKELGETTGTAIGQLTGKTDGASGAFSLLSKVLSLGTGVIKILGSQINGAITNIGNLAEAIRTTGGVVGDFFDFLKGEKSWDEVKGQADAAGEAFKKLGLGIVDGYTDLFGTLGEEILGFTKESEKLANKLELSYTSAFNETKTNFKSSFDAMITGQDEFVAGVLAGNNKVLTSFQQTSLSILAVNNLTTRDIIDGYSLVISKLEGFNQIQIQQQEMLQEEYKKTAETIITTFSPILTELGTALVNAEDGWQSFKDAAKNAIATIVEGFGKQWALQAAAALAGGNLSAAAGFGSASVAAFVASGVIRGLQSGGVARGLTLVGEQGPELIDVGQPSRVYNANESSQIMGSDKISMTVNNYINNQNDVELVNRKLGRLLENVLRKQA